MDGKKGFPATSQIFESFMRYAISGILNYDALVTRTTQNNNIFDITRNRRMIDDAISRVHGFFHSAYGIAVKEERYSRAGSLLEIVVQK